jgi:hypothetical protein
VQGQIHVSVRTGQSFLARLHRHFKH